nr:immunoglobulin heavy chain junction region [Mus musculus]
CARVYSNYVGAMDYW